MFLRLLQWETFVLEMCSCPGVIMLVTKQESDNNYSKLHQTIDNLKTNKNETEKRNLEASVCRLHIIA